MRRTPFGNGGLHFSTLRLHPKRSYAAGFTAPWQLSFDFAQLPRSRNSVTEGRGSEERIINDF
ncbi:hypothetical protein FNW02_24180 [Komarekiella sp. 'clone 1']|uniref:Uncharacterized protein n=1 Tax=Komarekiella delphini-convector SJRDD-AB1 TaxID=2593771 RepID=A0AA40T1C3_9NOST|nr:hypothetical protein [Komarekiella delphini-convector SJRDD-AB1]